MSMQATRVSLCVFFAFLRSLMLKVLAFARHMQQRSSSGTLEEEDRNLSSSYGGDHHQSLAKTVREEREDSVFLQSGLISNTSSNYQFSSAEAVIESMEQPETAKFTAQELFVGSNEALSEESRQGFQFRFPFNSYSSSSDYDKTETEDEVRFEKMKLDSDEIDNSYEVELNPLEVSAHNAEDSDNDDDDDDYIVFEQHKVELLHQESRILWHDDDDDDDDDVLKEHRDLVRQMKTELKNCRIKGLMPTISEEHGSPNAFEDLKKPFEFERKFEYGDAIDEIRRFYKIYAEKMRKLDVLNYQALQAISFIELTDKEAVKPCKKKCGSKFDKRKIYADSSHRSLSEVRRDLELIYVGQLCLSWEILSWSYIKARELIEYDDSSNRIHSYNRVSEDFQRFRVLLQRFMEDEPFQEERTAFYARRRCAARNLLQVPMIRDDCYGDKKQRTEEADAVSIGTLLNIVRESMFVFRDFLFSDKIVTNASFCGGIAGDDAKDFCSDSRVLADIIAALHTKEKRVKESMRSQSCIIKRLKRRKEEGGGGGHSEIFMRSQVDLKLVSRVLSLPRMTNERMLWCRMKLDGIGFVGRDVHVEPSFQLFPC